MKKLPEAYLNKMKELLNDEYESFISSYNNEATHSLRINKYKIDNDRFESLFNLKDKVNWCDDAYYFNNEDNLTKNPYYFAGLYYIQDASAMYPVEALDIKQGEIVLDLCASPGGKSLQILDKLDNKGFLVCNDISVSRSTALLKNLENSGHYNFCVISEDGNKLVDRFKESFDAILLDAPCSGTAMFRKDNKLINNWKEEEIINYSIIQKQLLDSAIKMLKKGGRIVYSTCSFLKEEDEDVVEYILNKYRDMHLEDLPKQNNFSSGISLKECIRLYPHRIKGEGHFISKLIKDGNKTINCEYEEYYLDDIKHPYINVIEEIRNNKKYLIPKIGLDLDGLRILRNGLLVGEIKNNKIDYSQHLSMSLNKDDFKNSISFDIDDVRILKYLKGESISIKDYSLPNDYILICLDDYPLGFGINNNGILKNKYPKTWRYQ